MRPAALFFLLFCWSGYSAAFFCFGFGGGSGARSGPLASVNGVDGTGGSSFLLQAESASNTMRIPARQVLEAVLIIRFTLFRQSYTGPGGAGSRFRREASIVARSGGLHGVDWIECRLWRSIANP